jgi:hypothetical protein
MIKRTTKRRSKEWTTGKLEHGSGVEMKSGILGGVHQAFFNVHFGHLSRITN